MIHSLLEALRMTGIMAWSMLWALCLGFLISGIIEAVVSKEQLSRLLPNSSPRTIVIASGLGAASSSCSYAATALARTLFRKGADFIAAIAFQFASTNLVVELSVLLAVMLGWQFTLAEFTGGPIMIALIVLLLRLTLKPRLIEAARKQAERGLEGKMEGHAAMDMSLHSGSFWQKLTSAKGITATSHYFWMDWYSLWPDIAGGLLISGCLAAWVSERFLEGPLPCRPPSARKAVGAAGRTDGCCTVLRVFRWKRPARSRALERRHQLRRRHRISVCRPHHPADPEHLPEVLRPQGRLHSVFRLLRRDVDRCTGCRVPVCSAPPDPGPWHSPGHDGAHLMELHLCAQYHFRGDDSLAPLAISKDRWTCNDEDDGSCAPMENMGRSTTAATEKVLEVGERGRSRNIKDCH